MKLSANFDSSEFACACGCGYNAVDPALVAALQALRDSLGCPVVITPEGGCRCAQHNAAVGGATRSQHMLGRAADIYVPGMTPRQVYAAAVQIPGFKGFGVNDQENFVHLDVRDSELVARWCYRNGSEAPWRDA